MEKQSLNHGWLFMSGHKPESLWEKLEQASWRTVELPHDWSIELERDASQPCGTHGGYFPNGSGWYAKAIQAPSDWRGRLVFIEFEGVYMNAEVWLNEHLLTRHPYGYTSFLVDLTPYLNIDARNVLRVYVDNASQINSRWYSGSGIYRPAWLMVAGPVHISHWGVYITTPEITVQSATVEAHIQVNNQSPASQKVLVRARVLDPQGIIADSAETTLTLPAAGEAEAALSFQIANPRLWSPDTPHLYRLESEVWADDQVVDRETTSYGVRSLAFSAEQGFLLNGQPLLIKGGCVHHDNGVLGAASYLRSEERKVELLKASGFNAIRCAHNPPAPSFLEACDRLGMLVIDEAFDCWRQGKNPYDYHVVFDDWWQRDIESMLRRDRNHPCIILWSIGNEVYERDGRSGGAEVARRLAEHVRALDPTRSVTAAICGVWDETRHWEDTDAVFSRLDIGGYNYQFKNYQPDHVRSPSRIMVGLESTPGEAFESWNCVKDLPYVIGDFVWTSLDYLGEAGIGRVHFEGDQIKGLGKYPWHQANCGDLDLCGFKRPQSYYRDVLWERGDPLYIVVHTPLPEGKTPTITYWGWPDVWPDWTWPGQEGQVFRVDVYSACEQVELFLNGESLGVNSATREERYIASFEVPYQAGELRAVGFRAGGPVAEHSLRTCGVPAQIRLTPDRPIMKAESGELCYITVEIMDSDGKLHPSADNPIYFTIKGPGVLLAVGNGNPVSTEKYVGNQRAAYHGRLLAVVKTNGNPGEIRLRAQADGLDGSELTILAR